MMPRPPRMPPEHQRAWLTIPGRVTAHERIEQRGEFSKWLCEKLPFLRYLMDGPYHMLVIQLDEQAYEQAGNKLTVPILDAGTQTVPPVVTYEVAELELHSTYPVDTPVGFSIGIAGTTAQWLGCIPTRVMVKKLLQPEDLLSMRNPILPQQASLLL